MYRSCQFSLFSLVLCSLPWGVSAAELTPAQVWKKDFAQAEAAARRSNRPILVHFYADWCGPCRRMERETLNSPELLRVLDRGFVAVKVNLDHHPAVGRRFQVEALPTDVLLSPDGRVLSKVQGYQEKGPYMSSVARVDAKYADTPKVQIAKTESRPPAQAPVAQTPRQSVTVPTAATQGSADEKLPPLPLDIPIATADTTIPTEDTTAQQQGPAPQLPAAVLALDGHCPVTLFMTRTWKRGSEEFAYEHQGMLFHLQGQQQLDAFKKDPTRFAPKLLGCDPVALLETDLAIPGSTRFGAYYEGELYLFETMDNRNRFRSNPERFTRVRHVLKPDDVKRERS